MDVTKSIMTINSARLDDLGIQGLSIFQDPNQFCFGMDAVLLSDFAKANAKEAVLDLCAGNGIIPILLSAKTKAKRIVGLEIQKTAIDLANKSIEHNKLSPRVEMIYGDLREIKKIFKNKEFDVVTSNPPYMKKGTGLTNEGDALTIARHEELCDFEDLMKACEWVLKPKGRFYLVHRPLRIPELLETMRKSKIEPKSMRLVYPYINKEANLVLIEGVKDAKPELRTLPPLIVYDKPGEYTDEVLKIYGIE